ncbi:MAG: zf-HC2 domain-containing protein [Coriobacteriia bacterium]|nr:zf-HC2 domain-containing protein [Coriobacteriia bacterium]
MNCREIDELLESYIRDELDDTTASVVADHLEGCARCQAAYEDTRMLVGELIDLGEAFQPTEAWRAPAIAQHVARKRPVAGRGWVAVAAAFAVLSIVSATLLTIPALARQVPVLPVARAIAALERDAAALTKQVEELETRLAEIGGEELLLVETEPALDEVENRAAQEHAMEFVRAMYTGDIGALQALATDELAARIAARPDDYLRSGGVVFAQINNISEMEGAYWVFIRMSDTVEFTDSQFQLNISLKRSGDGFLVSAVEMDA